LQVSTVEKSRVIAIDFSSTDPKLAADGANTIASQYIDQQRAAKRDTTADATKYLESEIADLRSKVKDAEAKVETYRSENGLFESGGQAPVTLPEQQLSDLNAELTKVRAARADAEAKAAQIRAGIESGSVPNLTDVLNSQLIQRLSEQQVSLKAQMAQLSATFLPGHPRMQELSAQIHDLDRQIAGEAQKILDSLEADAKLSKAREDEIAHRLDQMKVTAASANDAGVQLRALEREAAAQRDLLDTYLRRYREALSRQNGDYLPADARVVSAAAVAIEPDFPKKIPMTAAASVAILILAIAFILIRELASGRPMREVRIEPLPVVPDEKPVGGHVRWADDRGIRRMMPSEPTLAPEMESEVERSLAAIAERIVKEGRGRVMVTLAEGSDAAGRPLAAVALSRALAKLDRRVVLLDLHDDGADSVTMGDGADLPGFTDLYAGDASFAQVIFRDRRSRAHFIPAGRKPFPATLSGDLVNTVLSALDHTYDHVVVDAGEESIDLVAPSAAAAVVVTEFGAADPRTIRAFDRITEHSSAMIMLLVVDAAPAPAPAAEPEEEPERPEIAAADEAAA
jgi:Mrp family chromosome partitioning ATPase